MPANPDAGGQRAVCGNCEEPIVRWDTTLWVHERRRDGWRFSRCVPPNDGSRVAAPRPDNMPTTNTIIVAPGDVVQITNERAGLVGAFMLVEEVRSWGVIGFIHHVSSFEQSSQIPLRLSHGMFEYIGPAVLAPNGAA
jgi:hypothetical protein